MIIEQTNRMLKRMTKMEFPVVKKHVELLLDEEFAKRNLLEEKGKIISLGTEMPQSDYLAIILFAFLIPWTR